ncbi:MAG: S-layer homology domain-containing protein [Oscillospiraceae bacterium]|nr:S-layer homology domain-containing protein [Oscillospiraceae bacterium]
MGCGIYNSGSGNVNVTGGTVSSTYEGIRNTKGGTVTFDGGTISVERSNTLAAQYTYGISTYGTVYVMSGSVSADNNTVGKWCYGIDNHNGTVEISGGNISAKATAGSWAAGICMWGNGTANSATLTITGGAIHGKSYAISGSGNTGAGGTVINVQGGTITSDTALVYHPQDGRISITGGTLTAPYGIQLCSGTGTIASIGGDTVITATGTDTREGKTGDGLIPDGAAVSIVNRNYPGGIPSITISGGTFTAAHQDAVLAYTWSSNTASEWTAAKEHLVITDGTFSSNPSAYVDEGYTAYPTVGASTYSVLPSGTSYNVTVDYNRGGSDSTTQTFGYGETFTVPAAPSLAGYRFTGWSGGYTAGQQVAVTGDIDLTAGWELIVYDDSGDDSPSGSTANTNQQNNDQQQNNTSSTETIEDIATPLSNTDSVAVNEETTTNADGSTTTTTDYLDGSKTEVTSKTTENADGSKTTTSTGTLTDANGAKTEVTQETTTKTNSDGSTTAKTTSTETKSDGTTTKTESETTTKTASDGAKTETTTATATSSDGTKTETKSETVTAADGSSKATSTEVATAASGKVTTTATETVTTVAGDVTETKDISDSTGSKGTTVTENGVTTSAEATITTAAVTEAKASNEAVTLPVSVTAAESASEAATVSVTLPATAAGTTKVEVPVTAVTASTVAYVKNADGELELMKDCIVTENGVALGIEGSSEIVIVDNAKDFDDMPEADWASEAVQFVASREIFGGTSESTFEPKAEMSRGMVAQVLFNFDRESEATGTAAFADTTGKWFDDAAGWASSIGVITGDNGEFKGENSVTRQDLATMLYRYAETKGYKIDGGTSLSAYGDADSVSEYAAKAMEWAVGNGLIGGTDVGLEPQANATREQVAAIMMRFCAKIK